MFNFLKKINTPSPEQKETEKPEALSVLFLDTEKEKDMQAALNFYLNEDAGATFNARTKADFPGDVEDLLKKMESKGSDVIIIGTGNFGEEVIKKIKLIRESKKIKKQPIIFIMKSEDSRHGKGNKEMVELIKKEVDDIIELDPFVDFKKWSEHFKSIPELLSFVEDNYADFTLIQKQRFYKEYKDKITSRAEITADTEKELAILEQILLKNNASKILDAGGGNGRLSIPLSEKGYEMTNIDSSHELLEEMKSKTDKVLAVETDLRKLPVGDGQYDAVTFNWHVFCDILGVKSKNQVLTEAFRVLKDGGVIILDLPDREQGEFKKDGVYINYPGGESLFVGYVPSEEEMKGYLREAGFKEITSSKWETKSGFPKISFEARK